MLLIGCGIASTILCIGCEMATTGPAPPTGGQNYLVDYDVFASQIDSILTDLGCDNITCHGGGIRGTFQLSPTSNKDIDLDFAQTQLQINPDDPVSSPLLVKPLAESAGGVAHAADPQVFGFMSTADPAYVAILNWIESGEYQ
jgi:hypothetical protein